MKKIDFTLLKTFNLSLMHKRKTILTYVEIWKSDVIDKINKTLGKNYKFHLHHYAIMEPPLYGSQMVLFDDDYALANEINEVTIRKRTRNDGNNFSMLEENKRRREYNNSVISLTKRQIFSSLGIIRKAFYDYVANFNVYPLNSVPPVKDMCKTCFSKFTSRNSLFRHLGMTKHHVDFKITFVCNYCDEDFELQEDLDFHERFNHKFRIK